MQPTNATRIGGWIFALLTTWPVWLPGAKEVGDWMDTHPTQAIFAALALGLLAFGYRDWLLGLVGIDTNEACKKRILRWLHDSGEGAFEVAAQNNLQAWTIRSSQPNHPTVWFIRMKSSSAIMLRSGVEPNDSQLSVLQTMTSDDERDFRRLVTLELLRHGFGIHPKAGFKWELEGYIDSATKRVEFHNFVGRFRSTRLAVDNLLEQEEMRITHQPQSNPDTSAPQPTATS